MMDTPEKETLLETVRALRKEATEKLTGDRHDQAIQRLDEILEVVEKQDMSPAEISAVSNVLVGSIDTAPSAEPVDALVEHAAEVPDEASGDIVFEKNEDVPAPDVDIAGRETVLSDTDEVLVDLGTPEVDVAVADVPEVSAEPLAKVDEQVVEIVPEIADKEPSETGLGTIAALGAGALAAGALATNLVGDKNEAASEGGAVESPEVIAETPAIEIPEVEAPEMVLPEVAAPEVEVPEVALPEVVAEAAPPAELVEITDVLDVDAAAIAAPELDVASEVPAATEVGAIEIETLDLAEALQVEQVPEVELPAEESLQEVEIAAPVLPQVDLVDVAVPAIPEIEPVEIAAAPEVVPVAVVEDSPQMPELIPDIDLSKAAVVAAGAAVATVAGVSAAQNTENVEAAPAIAAPKVHTGSSLKHHPSYGGGRGNWFVRFINTLRGKDYI